MVGALCELQHAHHLLHLVTGELLVDGVEVGGPLCPKVKLHERPRVDAWLLQVAVAVVGLP